MHAKEQKRADCPANMTEQLNSQLICCCMGHDMRQPKQEQKNHIDNAANMDMSNIAMDPACPQQ